MEYEVGVRLDIIERAIVEIQHKLFPERFKDDPSEKKQV